MSRFVKTCASKRSWASKEDAVAAGCIYGRRSAVTLKVYRCPFCERYHLTSKKGKR